MGDTEKSFPRPRRIDEPSVQPKGDEAKIEPAVIPAAPDNASEKVITRRRQRLSSEDVVNKPHISEF